MWNWFNCHVSARHEYGVRCEPGAICLRCVHCGRRSPGWSVDAKAVMPVEGPRRLGTEPSATKAQVLHMPAPTTARILPFQSRQPRERPAA